MGVMEDDEENVNQPGALTSRARLYLQHQNHYTQYDNNSYMIVECLKFPPIY